MFEFIKKLFGKADLNQDGKVDATDAKVAAEVVKAEVKKTATRAKTAVKKATTSKTKKSQ